MSSSKLHDVHCVRQFCSRVQIVEPKEWWGLYGCLPLHGHLAMVFAETEVLKGVESSGGDLRELTIRDHLGGPMKRREHARSARIWTVIGMLLIFVMGASGCALFGIDDDLGFDLPISAEHTFNVPIDLGALPTSGSVAPQRLETPLPLPPAPVDLTQASPELNSNKDKLESVEITKIRVTPKTNSLTAALPPLELYVGPSGAMLPADGILIATIPSIPAGSTAEVPGQIDAVGMAAAQTHITSLKFAFIPASTLIVEEGQTVPGGSADLEITLEITATVDPTK